MASPDTASKGAVEHAEDHQVQPADLEDVPSNYFYSARFIGTGFAVAINLLSSTGGFAMLAPILGYIDADIGPGSIIWVALVYTMMLAIGLTLVGQLSDVFGRRYFFIGGTLLGAIGAVIASRAQTIPVLIGGETLVGLSAATGYSYVSPAPLNHYTLTDPQDTPLSSASSSL